MGKNGAIMGVNVYKIKSIMNRLIEEIIHGGHLAGSASASIVLTFGLINGNPLNLPLLAIIYMISLVVYSYGYYSDMDSNFMDLERAVYLKQKAKTYPYIMAGYVALLAALIIIFEKNIQLAIIIMILLAAGIVYTAGLKRLTKYIPGFRSIYVAAEWSLASALFYALYCEKSLFDISWPILGFVFLKFLINVIFSDMKDIKSDILAGFKTIPIVFGRKGTVKFLYLLNLISLLPIILGIYMGLLSNFALILVFFVIYDFYYLYKADKSRGALDSKYYVLADFEITCWPVVVIISILLLDVISPLEYAALVMLLVLALVFIRSMPTLRKWKSSAYIMSLWWGLK